MKLIPLLFLLEIFALARSGEIEEEPTNNAGHKVEGRVIRPDTSLMLDHEWFGNTKVYTNTGHYGLLKEDGSFVINNLPWGSHVIFVMSPTYVFDAIRVDVNSKGKIRARTLNNIQPSKVDLVSYPLRLRSLGVMKYFQQREQWKLTDIIFNPMIMMTLFPLVFMLIMPKMTDPARKESEQLQMPKLETPELSEMMTSFFGGGAASSSTQQKAKLKLNKRKDK